MSTGRSRAVVAVLVAVGVVLVALVLGGAIPGLPFGDDADRPDDPSTTGTVGYVEGYWYDDELAVDDAGTATLEDEELEAVVYRSMARVERIQERSFESTVPVDVVSREEFQADNDDLFADVGPDGELQANVNYEALFMVERGSDAVAAYEGMYDGTVLGYYDPEEDRIVVVSDGPESPEVDELTLGHELVHALQDQHVDLTSVERETMDQDNARNGLIEGDAAWTERAYEERCGEAWSCLPSVDGEGADFSALNWGIYLSTYQPYSDGPAYVDHLFDRGGREAVETAYDDPPTSSSEVIRPGEEREPAAVAVEDRSSDGWRPLEVENGTATETVGEAGMVAMFGADGLEGDATRPVIALEDLLEGETTGYDYDQPHTDGWAGDELVTYVTDEADPSDDPVAAAEHAGFVWETEWSSETDAREFATGYLDLLENHGASAVADRQDTYELEDGYPGAYYLERDDETMTIVRAPSVDALADVRAGAAPPGEDDIEPVDVGAASSEGGDEDDPTVGFGAPAAAVGAALALLGARVRSAG